MNIPKYLYQIADTFKKNNYQCFLVGGAVRDLLRKIPAKDYDIATDARPKDVISIFKRVIPTGIKHGTVTVLFKGQSIEVTTFRLDSEYSDGRHPDKVKFTPSIFEDLKRRDFTINAIAYDLIKHRLFDPFDGKSDLKKGIIKAIGDPEQRFREDGLRTLRACRFVAQLNFKIQKKTADSIKQNTNLIKHVSSERIQDEIKKILISFKPSLGFISLNNTGLLKHIIPELSDCIGIEQPELHAYDVFHHSIYSCDAAPQDNLAVRIAALFHDIGKSKTALLTKNGSPRFYGHEKVSTEQTKNILKRLKFSNKIIKKTTHLIKNHMFSYDSSWSYSAVRRFIQRVGYENIDDLFALRRADQYGMRGEHVNSNMLLELRTRIIEIIQSSHALSIKDLKINGEDLIKELSLEKGKIIGTILDFLLESVIEDPELNFKPTLLNIAKKYYNDRLKIKGK